MASDAQSDPRKRRGLAGKLGLFALTLVLALGLAEVASRVIGLGIPARGETGLQGIVRNVPADEVPGVEFLLVPNQERNATYPGGPGEPPRVITYGINGLGFRGAPAQIAKAPNTLRIAVLGDSFTYGTGVDQGETWPVQFEALLDQRPGVLPPGIDAVEVFNWAVPAYNTRQQVALLELRAAEYQPDLVLLCAYINDASGEARADGAGTAGAEPLEVRWIRRLGLTSGRWETGKLRSKAQARTNWLRSRSRLVDMAAHRLHSWLSGRVTDRNYIDDWAPGSPGLAMVQSALQRAADIAQREGFAFRATMYPDLAGLAGDYRFSEQHAVFEALCRDLGVPFHDLLPSLAGTDPNQLTAHAHDKHPNAEANRRVAEHLAQQLAPVLGTLERR